MAIIAAALESCLQMAWLLANTTPDDGYTLLTLSGRGDKDLAEVVERLKMAEPGTERIAAAFASARGEGRAGLMPYMVGGYPDHETSLTVAAAYVIPVPT